MRRLSYRWGFALVGAWILWGSGAGVWGIDRYILKVQATATETASPQIVLNWDTQATGANVSVYRRVLGQEGNTWGTALATVTHPLHSFTDTSVTATTVYEYKLYRPAVGSTADAATAYICSGAGAPLADSRGKVLIIADQTLADALAPELNRLVLDMVGDGWQPVYRTYARHGTGTPEGLRALIQSEYGDGSTGLKAVCLVGKLPRVKSGYQAPDGHSVVPQEADVFYADMDGTWTDASTYGTVNVPGDGIYDNSYLPGNRRVELQLGRVDLAEMTAWTKVHAAINEENLLRLYLDKDHCHRAGRLDAPRRGTYAQIGYLRQESSNLVALFGDANTTNTGLAATHAGPYLGGVDFYNWNGAAYSTETLKTQFTINFGSGKLYWSNGNNAMRGILAQRTYGLTCGWGSRPFWYFHQMGMGETIGYCTYRTQNNYASFSDYTPQCSYSFGGGVWVDLMGDPTLRLHAIAPLTGITAQAFGNYAVVYWNASDDPRVTGYHVYRADALAGPYTRLTAEPVAATSCFDAAPRSATVYYMVRPVKLEQSISGTYWNAGTGVFTYLKTNGATNHPPVAPDMRIRVVTNTTLPVTLTGTDADGDTVTAGIVEQPAHGWVVGKDTAWTYIPDAGYAGPDRFRYMLRDDMAVSEGVVDVTVGPANTAPTAHAQSVACARGEAKAIGLTGSDPQGDGLGFAIATQPQHGTLTGTPPAVVYRSDAAYSGPDSFTFTVTDGALSSPAATVSVTVAAASLATATTTATAPGLYCRRYSGLWTALPDYSAMAPEARNVVATVSIAGQGTANFGCQFAGLVEVPTTGTYTFYLLSDAGSRLYVGGECVVDNDGLHGATELSGQTTLGQGKHPLRVDYFEATGTAQLTASFEGPAGLVKQEIPASALSHVPNEAPVAVSQDVTMRHDTVATIAIGATDPEGGALAYGLERPFVHGAFAGMPPLLYYAPAPGYVGTDSMRYTAADADGNVVAGEVLVHVTGANPPTVTVR